MKKLMDMGASVNACMRLNTPTQPGRKGRGAECELSFVSSLLLL